MRLDCLEHVKLFTSGSAVHRIDCRWWETVDKADTQKCIAGASAENVSSYEAWGTWSMCNLYVLKC